MDLNDLNDRQMCFTLVYIYICWLQKESYSYVSRFYKTFFFNEAPKFEHCNLEK